MMNKYEKTGALLAGALFAGLLLAAAVKLLGLAFSGRALQPPPGGGHKILCLGDSFTYGLGAAPEESYPYQLQRLLSGRGYAVTVVNGGVVTQNSSQLVAGLQHNIDKERPDAIVLLTGKANGWNLWGYEGGRRGGILSALPGAETAGKLARLLSASRPGAGGATAPEPCPSAARSLWTCLTGRGCSYAAAAARRLAGRGYCTPGFAAFNRGSFEEAAALFGKRLAAEPGDLDARDGLCWSLYSGGREKEGEACFRETARLAPADPRAYRGLAQLLSGKGRHREALALLEAGEAAGAPLAAVKAGTLEARGDLPAALAAYGALVKAFPGSGEGYHGMARVLLKLGRGKEAGQWYARAPATPPGGRLPEGEMPAICVAGEISCSAAAACMERAELAGARIFDLSRVGNICRREGKLDEALRWRLKAAASSPPSAAAMAEAGLLLLELGRAGEALGQFEAALALKPASPGALAGKGTALLVANRPAEAARVFARERELSPLDPSACFRLGLAHAAAGDPAKARYWHEQGVAANPAYRLNYSALGWLDLYEKKHKQAAEWFLWAAVEKKNSPPGRAEDRLALAAALQAAVPETAAAADGPEPRDEGAALLEAGRPGDALKWYASRPDSPEAQLGRGKALRALGRRGEAVTEFTRCAAARPSWPYAYKQAGETFREAGLPEEALRWFLAGVRAAPGAVSAGNYQGLASVLTELGLSGPAEGFFSAAAGRHSGLKEVYASVKSGGIGNDETERWVRRDLEKALEICGKNKVRLVLATYPEREKTPQWLRLASLIRGEALLAGVSLADNFAAFEALGGEAPGYFAPEGHPNGRGYAVMAETAAAALPKEWLKKGEAPKAASR